MEADPSKDANGDLSKEEYSPEPPRRPRRVEMSPTQTTTDLEDERRFDSALQRDADADAENLPKITNGGGPDVLSMSALEVELLRAEALAESGGGDGRGGGPRMSVTDATELEDERRFDGDVASKIDDDIIVAIAEERSRKHEMDLIRVVDANLDAEMEKQAVEELGVASNAAARRRSEDAYARELERALSNHLFEMLQEGPSGRSPRRSSDEATRGASDEGPRSPPPTPAAPEQLIEAAFQNIPEE